MKKYTREMTRLEVVFLVSAVIAVAFVAVCWLTGNLYEYGITNPTPIA